MTGGPLINDLQAGADPLGRGLLRERSDAASPPLLPTELPQAAAPPVAAQKRRFPVGLGRGLTRRCPNCGKGALFRGYLKVEPLCAACGHDNAQYRADDGPAYFTILIVGHVIVAPLFALSIFAAWSPFVLLGVGLPLVGLATLTFLPFLKGGWIGVLWATTHIDALEAGPRDVWAETPDDAPEAAS
jgi:uncharacterized protein (DUF983 family)